MYFEMDCSCKGKNLDKLLQPNILHILRKQSLHGFAIIAELGKSPMFNGVEPDATGVYRYLKKMEASGLLSSKMEKDENDHTTRKVYSITDRGKHCLYNWKIVLSDYNSHIQKLIDSI